MSFSGVVSRAARLKGADQRKYKLKVLNTGGYRHAPSFVVLWGIDRGGLEGRGIAEDCEELRSTQGSRYQNHGRKRLGTEGVTRQRTHGVRGPVLSAKGAVVGLQRLLRATRGGLSIVRHQCLT